MIIVKSGGAWRNLVFVRDGFKCAATRHAEACTKRPEEAHHIVYRSQIGSAKALWVVENGVTLSLQCHALAHRTHNANINLERKRAAVDAINSIVTKFKVPYFEDAA